MSRDHTKKASGANCSQYITKVFQMLRLRYAQATAQAKMKLSFREGLVIL